MRLAATKTKSPSPARKSPVAPKSVTVSHAKTHLLTLINDVDKRGESLILTRRGRPIARLVPIEPIQLASIFGCMKGTFEITGDIVGPEPDVWEAMQ